MKNILFGDQGKTTLTTRNIQNRETTSDTPPRDKGIKGNIRGNCEFYKT